MTDLKSSHLRVRLKPELYKRTQAAATKGHRSQTAEVAKRLEESFRQEDLKELIKQALAEVLEARFRVKMGRQECP